MAFSKLDGIAFALHFHGIFNGIFMAFSWHFQSKARQSLGCLAVILLIQIGMISGIYLSNIEL